ncbi:MAG: peptidase A26 omptin [uncultured bacterium]|nr:MAG: peptidase A26 omptin [uncultured bacterium]
MNKGIYMKLFISLIFVAVSLNSYALSAINGQNMDVNDEGSFKAEFGIETAMVNGSSREYVYESQIKLSELVWEIDDAIMLGAVGSVQFNEKVGLNVGSWSMQDSSDGQMEDSDWLDPYEQVETHYSFHRTTLDKGNVFDINAAYTFLTLTGEEVTSMNPNKTLDTKYSLQGLIGYKKEEWKWTARGGYYVYGINSPYYSTSFGMVDDVETIKYEHETSIPYFGACINLSGDEFGVNAFLIYSKWVEVEDEDLHLSRDIRYREHFNDGEFWGCGLNLKWNITDRLMVLGSYNWEDVKKVYGATEIYLDGDSALIPWGAAFSQRKESIGVSLAYKFG